MKKFELFMCCLGNGITVCDKAVEENGDYKSVAHIAECGKITWYVNPMGYVPSDALLKIEHAANVQHEKWEQWLSSMPKFQQYQTLLDAVPMNVMISVMNLDCGLEGRIHYLKKMCYEKAYF